MAWENVLKKQSDRLTTLLDDALVKWRAGKQKAKAGTLTADEVARNMTIVWDNMLKFWWGPFDTGDPVVPTLLMTSPPSNPGPVSRDVRLLDDTDTASITLTPLGLVGGTGTITTITGAVTDGSKLTVSVFGIPATTGLYQGLALVGKDPVATIILKVG